MLLFLSIFSLLILSQAMIIGFEKGCTLQLQACMIETLKTSGISMEDLYKLQNNGDFGVFSNKTVKLSYPFPS